MLLYAFIILICFEISTSHPFILDQYPSRCDFNSNTSFTSELLKAETENIVIYYTLCGYLPINTNCGVNVTACLINKHDHSTSIMGKKFILGSNQNLYLEASSSSYCKANPTKKYNLAIKLDVLGDTNKDEHLEIKNECEYVIHRIPPDFQPICTTKISGLLVDLRPLKELNKIFWVNSEERNFSLTLCASNKECNNKSKGISSCIINNQDIIPLSKVDSEEVLYHEEKNELSIHGSYKGERKQDNKKFELLLKCNWDIDAGKISYKKVHQQGKQYKFEMESIYGCVKLPPHCEIIDKFFIYNLTGLYNSQGYIEVSNIPNNGKMYLNVCGPLKLKGSRNNCTKAFSQVCEVLNGVYINRGSISSKMTISDDIIKVTYTDGTKCNEGYQYSTNINFMCSKSEQGPVFDRYDACVTFINWYTPSACPKYEVDNCNYIQQEYHECVTTKQGYHYDLSDLTRTNKSYEIEDTTNKSIKYVLNVCGPAIDPDAPCMKNSMVLMKDSKQNNLKYKVKSLGKMFKIYVANKEVIIETSSGTYCEGEGDYSSIIRFICSDKEEQPQLINRTQCTFQFQWKTPSACPINVVDKCVFRDNYNFLLDFTNINKTLFKINLNGYNNTFDFCKNNYTECSLTGNCTSHPVKKTLVRYSKRTYLEFVLTKQCISKTDFNKVSCELVCDKIINNDHFQFIKQNNCTIMMKFFTNLVCTEEDLLDKTKYKVIDERNIPENCSINNPLTGYNFYISNLQTNMTYVDCPEVIFNKQNSSVMVIYSNDTACADEYGNHIAYRILLQCSKTVVNQSWATACSRTDKFLGPEYCKLFETSILENHSTTNHTTAIIIGSMIGGLAFVGICIFLFIKIKKRISRLTYDKILYEKDADL